MSIEKLFKHSVRVYRFPAIPESRGTLGSTSKSPIPVTSNPSRFNAQPDVNWAGAQTDKGPGEQQGAKRRWFLDKGIDVRDRDVLSVTKGAEAGLKLFVESVAKPENRIGVHHVEVIGSVWKGVLGE